VPDRSMAVYRIGKRLIDILIGSILLVLCMPIILLAALAIRLESPGNPFFVQTRVGLRGKRFKIFKLRGMYVDARERFPHLYDYRRYNTLDFYFHYEHDPRTTRVGKFLRRTSIDEFPNFLNVLLGTMTLVGPRPEIPEVLSLYGQRAVRYTSVKPGVTCLSKITGRDLLTKAESVSLDLGYIQDMSFWLDMKILWTTFENVLLVRGELPKVDEAEEVKATSQTTAISTQSD
jgi:lipopolysaccharide/colanic/teichoic acid biosynthesis glycosyltransferase